MLKNKSPLALLLTLILCVTIPAQDPKLAWLGEYIAFPELAILQPVYSTYSKDDLSNFRDRLRAVRSATDQNEWEGRFVPGGIDEVGISVLDISLQSGFASLYIYTCIPELRTIDYGSVISRPDMVELVSDVPPGSPRKATRARFVKVKWGSSRYLVDERSLAAWTEKAAGIYVTPANGRHAWSSFWESGDPAEERLGEPELPARFAHLKRRPIQTTITKVAPRKIVKEASLGNTYYTAKSAVYPVVLGVGRNLRVKKDMVFQMGDSGDEIVITNVYPRSASGLIVRAINEETLADHCLSDTLEKPAPIQCPEIKAGSAVSTIVGKFWF